jgi:hypothetical protein
MKTKSVIILVSICYLVVAAGCAGKKKIQIQKKLLTMSDSELVNHYEMLEMRIDDIDRTREQSIDRERDLWNNSRSPERYQNHLGHLHIGDNWNELKKEKEMTLIEMRKRGISLP